MRFSFYDVKQIVSIFNYYAFCYRNLYVLEYKTAGWCQVGEPAVTPGYLFKVGCFVRPIYN
jgi:hypothetical protein